jgi:hypothetical protein
MRPRIVISGATDLLASARALGVPLALGVGQTRDSHVAAVEAICKANTKANERIFAGVRKEVGEGRLESAASKSAKAAEALKRTLAELKAAPEPFAKLINAPVKANNEVVIIFESRYCHAKPSEFT